jgi:hypothetical protein
MTQKYTKKFILICKFKLLVVYDPKMIIYYKVTGRDLSGHLINLYHSIPNSIGFGQDNRQAICYNNSMFVLY